MGIYGIDVSSYQSEHYPLTVKGHTVSFSIIKATEGTSYVNPRMRGQAAWARSHGHVVGFYHFLHPGSVREQAKFFVERCDSREGDILACDWESTSSGHASGAEKDAFIKEVKRLRPDHRVILYCNVSDWKTRDTTSFAGDGLWIAQYNNRPARPSIQADWLIHQYTSTPVDTNVADFTSRDAMRTWARGLIKGGSTPTKPTTPSTDKDGPMQLSDKVELGEWIPAQWSADKGLADGQISVETALGSTYGHSRYVHDKISELTAKVDALTALVKSMAKE